MRDEMCGVKLFDKVACEELRDRLGLEDVVIVLHRDRLRWYGDVLRKDDSVWWINVCILRLKMLGLEETKENMEGSSGGGYEEFEVKEDTLVRGKWRRLIRGTVEDSDDSGG